MSIHVEAIAFNHDPSSATADAVNVRRNFREHLPVPEWRRGTSVEAEDSKAAYALRETRGNSITIQAKFSCSEPDATTIEVRAIESQQQPTTQPWMPWSLPSAYYWNYYDYYRYLWFLYYMSQQAAAFVGSVLGEVKARQVVFQPNGESRFETFELRNPQLWTRGVGIHIVSWQWQYRRTPGEQWQNLEMSNHQIYSLLEVPKEPWLQFPYNPANTQLPWTEVLDYACQWAQGTHTFDQAAARITRAVNSLGPDQMRYGCEVGAVTQYTNLFYPYFDCEAVLERLKGGIGQGVYVNCTDCACIVSTFANSLGCDLWQARMGNGLMFELNPILAIGRSGWQPACGGPGFTMHEVAWKWPCTEDEEVFDACLQVDVDVDPSRPPHTPILPMNMRFGRAGEGQYRDRLCTRQGTLDCIPQSRLGLFRPVRRLVTDQLLFDWRLSRMMPQELEDPLLQRQALTNLEQRSDYESWSGRNTLEEELFIWQFSFGEDVIPRWRLHQAKRIEPPALQRTALSVEGFAAPAQEGPRVTRSMWRPRRGKTVRLVKAEVYECASRAAAHEHIVRFLGEFQTPLVARKEEGAPGDVAFADQNNRVILFARANLICLVMSVGDRVISVAEIAEQIDQDLTSKPEVSLDEAAAEFESLTALRAPEPEHRDLLSVAIPQLKDRPVMYKFFSRSGEVRAERGQIVYHPMSDGEQDVQVYAVTPARGAAHREIQFNIG